MIKLSIMYSNLLPSSTSLIYNDPIKQTKFIIYQSYVRYASNIGNKSEATIEILVRSRHIWC